MVQAFWSALIKTRYYTTHKWPIIMELYWLYKWARPWNFVAKTLKVMTSDASVQSHIYLNRSLYILTHTVPVSWSTRGPCWGCGGVQWNWRALQGQQPCYLAGLESVSLSAWQQGDWGGLPWWQRVWGGRHGVGAPEDPQSMKTEGVEESV